MVGTDPRVGGSTTVHTVIIPLKMNFVAGGQDPSSLVNQGYAGFQPQFVNHTFDGTSKLAQTEASPVFSDYVYPSDLGGDTGQLGDVYMRAQFKKILERAVDDIDVLSGLRNAGGRRRACGSQYVWTGR